MTKTVLLWSLAAVASLTLMLAGSIAGVWACGLFPIALMLRLDLIYEPAWTIDDEIGVINTWTL